MDRLKLVDRNGVVCNPGEPYVAQYPWVNLGSLNTAISALAVDGRDRTSVAALINASSVLELQPPMVVATGEGIGNVPNGAEAYKIRMRASGAEDADFVVDILSCANPIASEYYTRRARLTCTQGTQVHTTGSIYFIDEIQESLTAWTTDSAEIQPTSPDNHIAEYSFNVHGDVSFVFVPITIPSGTLYIDARRIT